jgi:uncharacterized protein DUF1326
MRKILLMLSLVAIALCFSVLAADTPKPESKAAAPAGEPAWHMNATAIEACSCPMFCQCYFNTAPAGHHEHAAGGETHYCKANLAYKINHGKYGDVNLDGAKFWVVTDLGPDFSKGQMDWAIVYFDKTLSKQQRDGIAAVVGHLFPVKWNSLTTEEANIDTWTFDKHQAHATLDGGKTAEVKLKAMPGLGGQNPVIKNLIYWGAPRNDGFVLMPNEVEAYRVGPKAFEFKNSNGFMITVDMSSADLQKAAGSN